MYRDNTHQAGKPDCPIITADTPIQKAAVASNLLNHLLARGDQVSIEGGNLVLIPASGNPVPSDWFDANESELVEQIAVQTGVIILRYAEYSAGAYGTHLFQGVTLQFDCVTTLTDAYAIFNAILTRARTTKHGAAGKPLPKKHFRLHRKHELTKFLKRSGIQPRRLSDAYKSMGKLKGLLFSASLSVGKGSRLESDSITPLNLTHQHLLELLETPRQQRDNTATKYRDKETADSHTQSDFQPIYTTGVFNHGKRTTLPREYGTRVTITPYKHP